MPFVRIDLRKGKSDPYRQEVGRVVYEAMLSVGVPKDDRFQVIAEHDPANFVFDPNLTWHSPVTEDLVIIQITWNDRGARSSRRRRFTRRSPDGLAASSQPAPGRRLHQPGGGQKGELVIRQWGRAIRLSYSWSDSSRSSRAVRCRGACLFAWNASAPGPKTVVNQPQAAVRAARKYEASSAPVCRSTRIRRLSASAIATKSTASPWPWALILAAPAM